MSEETQHKEILRPEFLFHASPNKNISVFEPRAESVRDPEEGPVVFATPDEVYASQFLVNTDDSWTNKGRFGGNTYYIVISDRERFEKLDTGGSIYTLPPDGFETKEGKGMGNLEWTSKTAVKPIDKKDFDSGLQAMLGFGVQVFFVDKDTFMRIIDSSDHGNSILRSLESENKILGINYIRIPSINKR